ncbi:MAG TPA: Xaa-Pro peptidase family protein [Acidimicrobiia bacterium]
MTATGAPAGTELHLGRMRRERRGRLTAAMATHGLDGLVLLGQANVAYATGARVPAAEPGRAARQRPVAVLTREGEAHLFTAFPEGAPPELPAAHVHGALATEDEAGARALVEVVPAGRVAFDEYTMPVRAALAGREVADASPVLGEAKIVKTADELECIRRAQAVNEAAIVDVAAMVRAGLRATELSGRLLRRVFELGASANTVDPIFQVMPPSVAAGPYSASGGVVFPTPTRPRTLAAGDVIWVDTGINFEGYASDFGCTWVVGGVDAHHREQFERWRTVVDAALGAVRPGATAADVGRAATAAAGGRRPWLPHLYLAHGIGTDSAEMPYIGTDLGDAFDDGIVLAPGMVLVFEPVIWDDGRAGYRAEEIVAVTETGWTMLSARAEAPR